MQQLQHREGRYVSLHLAFAKCMEVMSVATVGSLEDEETLRYETLSNEHPGEIGALRFQAGIVY